MSIDVPSCLISFSPDAVALLLSQLPIKNIFVYIFLPSNSPPRHFHRTFLVYNLPLPTLAVANVFLQMVIHLQMVKQKSSKRKSFLGAFQQKSFYTDGDIIKPPEYLSHQSLVLYNLGLNSAALIPVEACPASLAAGWGRRRGCPSPRVPLMGKQIDKPSAGAKTALNGSQSICNMPECARCACVWQQQTERPAAAGPCRLVGGVTGCPCSAATR